MSSDGHQKFIDQLLKETFEISTEVNNISGLQIKESRTAIYQLQNFGNFFRLTSENLSVDFPRNWGPFESLTASSLDKVIHINKYKDVWNLIDIFPLIDISGPSWALTCLDGNYYLISSEKNKWEPSLEDIQLSVSSTLSAKAA